LRAAIDESSTASARTVRPIAGTSLHWSWSEDREFKNTAVVSFRALHRECGTVSAPEIDVDLMSSITRASSTAVG
jgi:hypothetical protein